MSIDGSRRDVARRYLGHLNRYFMVPAFRLGLGSWIGNPLAGYIAVLRTRGRKTGLPRHAPLNYAILDGSVYVVSGWGTGADWYRNLQADPRVDLLLPGRTIGGRAETVTDPGEILRAGRQVLLASGFAAYVAGVDPRRITDEDLGHRLADIPVVRIRPTGPGAGPHDPGGRAWIAKFAMLSLAIACWRVRRARRARHR